jgi:hypothetical protein
MWPRGRYRRRRRPGPAVDMDRLALTADERLRTARTQVSITESQQPRVAAVAQASQWFSGQNSIAELIRDGIIEPHRGG